MLYFCFIGQKILNVICNNVKWIFILKFLKFLINFERKRVNFFYKLVVKNNMGYIKELYFE